jgi:hypothetical protein
VTFRWRRSALILAVAVVYAATLPGSGAARTLALTVIHTVRGCHAWQTTAPLGPSATLTVARGATLRIRISCPMDFDVRQTAGPTLRLGGRRLYTGTTRTVLFAKPGLYRLTGKNVQTAEERGLETLGPDNTLQITVRVK